MARLGDLPPEMLELIFSSGRENLTALMSVCKSIHRVSELLLYEEIVMMWDDCMQPASSIDLLLRSVLEQPKLALLIKHIRLRNKGNPAFKPARCQLSREVMDHAGNIVRHDRFPSPGTWTREMQKGCVPIVVAFLLSRLQKLETLELGVKYQSVYLGDMFKHALSHSDSLASISTFRQLKRVELSPEAYSPRAGILGLEETMSFLRLPSMQSLSFLALDGQGFRHSGPCNQILRTLDLHHSQIREDSLERLLAVVPNLKSFRCSLWCDPEPIDDRSPFLDCEALGKALKHIRLIEHLAVSVKFFTSSAMEVDWGGAYEKGEHWGIKGNIGSLSELVHLKSLEVPIVVLLGWAVSYSAPQLADILPKNLRQLLLKNDLNFFYKYEWDQQACLDRLSEYLRLQTCSASLDEITVRLRDCAPEDRWDQDAKKELRLLCGEAGVSCVFDPPA